MTRIQRLMALDVGDKTIGVAVCDELGITVTGVTTIRRKGHKHDLPQLEALIAEREIEALVVGLPRNMDGSEGAQAEKTRRFAGVVKERFGLPVYLHDERLSSAEAEQRMEAAGVARKRWRELVDQYAAEVILQSYLDAGCPTDGAV